MIFSVNCTGDVNHHSKGMNLITLFSLLYKCMSCFIIVAEWHYEWHRNQCFNVNFDFGMCFYIL